MNNKVFFATGRDYGTPQVLEITYIAPKAIDDFEVSALDLMTAHFTDAARGISGQVNIFAKDATAVKIGSAVLAEYDAGNYQ
jgi:hypothetical protein